MWALSAELIQTSGRDEWIVYSSVSQRIKIAPRHIRVISCGDDSGNIIVPCDCQERKNKVGFLGQVDIPAAVIHVAVVINKQLVWEAFEDINQKNL